MSIHERGKGRWVVRYREDGKQKSRTVFSESEAVILDNRIRHAHRQGEGISVPTLSSKRRGQQGNVEPTSAPSLEQYLVEPYGEVQSFYERRQKRLASSTRKLEAGIWDRCIGSKLGHIPIDEIDSIVIEDWRDGLLRQDKVGIRSVERAQKIVSKILGDAARRGIIQFNPAAAVRYIKLARNPIIPLEPVEVERIARHLTGQDAFIVRFLGCSGLRPGELLGTGESQGVKWKDIRHNGTGATLTVHSGKTSVVREVRILGPLLEDIDAYRASVSADKDDLIVLDPNGEPWSDSRYRNWRARQWRKACEAAGVGQRRPYDLRHGFASLLLHEGRSITFTARQLGNDPRVLAKEYAHVLDKLSYETTTITAEQAIRQARKQSKSSPRRKIDGAKSRYQRGQRKAHPASRSSAQRGRATPASA